MVDLPIEGHVPGFDGDTGWLNSAPLRAADLRGKVVLSIPAPTPASTGSARLAMSGPVTGSLCGGWTGCPVPPPHRDSSGTCMSGGVHFRSLQERLHTATSVAASWSSTCLEL
jgi:hypothetical protein